MNEYAGTELYLWAGSGLVNASSTTGIGSGIACGVMSIKQ
jgi:hypothetical protein